MFFLTGILGFIFLLAFFASALRGAELHSKAATVRESPLQKLLWRLLGKWTGYLFAVFILECLLLAAGGAITNWLGPIAGALFFGAGLAATIYWWPKEA